tara:strand:+ start:10917 stop:12131 length:1215 start_codon:yes stop_codon:yes gene_type:complete
MADLEAVNAVTSGNIEAVNGVSKANIQAVNGCEIVAAASGATRWVAGFDGLGQDFYISFAAPDDLSASAWENNAYTADGDSPDTYELVYGKDSNGNPLWVVAVNAGSGEILHDDDNDVTDGATWTQLNLTGSGKARTVMWGENGNSASCFIGVGGMTNNNQYVHRSEGGTSWSSIDVSGLSNLTTDVVLGLATDGLGVWMFAQKDRLYISTNNGSSWTQLQDGSSNNVIPSSGADIYDIVYTNSSWVIFFKWDDPNDNPNAGTRMWLQSCAAGDRSDWGTPLLLKDSNDSYLNTAARKMTGAFGKIIAHDKNAIQAATVSGKTLTLVGDKVSPPDRGNLYAIGFDGTTLLTGSQGSSSNPAGGDICKATDWPPTNFGTDPVAHGINHNGNRRVYAILPNVHMPL